MASAPIIVWFRRDLRLRDNPALSEACAAGAPVLPLFVLETDAGRWAPGEAARWWLHHSLQALAGALERRGSRLILRSGSAAEVVPRLAVEVGARAVVWTRRHDPEGAARDDAVAAALGREGIEARGFDGALLFAPEAVVAAAGTPYRTFAAFARACRALPGVPAPVRAPQRIAGPCPDAEGETLEQWPLLSSSWLPPTLGEHWQPGEAAAQERLARLLAGKLSRYHMDRDRPDVDGTSRLSPHLAFGEISAREVWHAAYASGAFGDEKFREELLWREFCYNLIFHAPHLPDRPLRQSFEHFPWGDDGAGFDAWRDGLTGYPIVDAGMRQLRTSGWMHNRVRMIAASFLVKDLLVPWQRGEEWFWRRLVDGDLACNAGNWQWVAGCGIDAAPYFRIFNPVIQAEKFDSRGHYVRAWLPELAGLPDLHIHCPWKAPADVLAAAGVRLGETYPRPIVDHAAARRRALAAYQRITRRRA